MFIVCRAKRISPLKLRASTKAVTATFQRPAAGGAAASAASYFPSLATPAFKVKPKIVAEAYSKMTYVKPSATGPSGEASFVPSLVPLTGNHRGRAKKTLTDEQWLFGTLGDEWDDTGSDDSSVTMTPWSFSGHTSCFV